MPAIVTDTFTLALFNLGGGEIILILALMVILFGAKKLPELARGIGDGISEFRKALWAALWEIRNAFDRGAHDAGKSLGGIYGKGAAEAITPDNQVAELYDPTVFKDKERTHEARKPGRFWSFGWLWRWIRKFFDHG